ncbi:MAG: peroxiredoxin [Euryarchaeota archaeon]|nr:peroxiredoxin [Euryarchaeota archaeon]
MPLLKPGDPAPPVEGLDQNGKHYSGVGKNLVLYFYPKDDTPGCTVEACGFRDDLEKFRGRRVEVVGVSVDGVVSHKNFEAKHSLNFPLLADHDKRITRAYGALSGMGFANRVTYLVGADGKVKHVWPSVGPKTHSAEVLAKIQELGW